MDNNGSEPRTPDVQMLSVPRAEGGEHADTVWHGGPSFDTSNPHAGAGLIAYWHAFRRRWLAATLLGLLVGGIAAPAVWFTYHPQYTAVSTIRIAASPETILPGGADRSTTAYDIYKSTQQQYIRSRSVLITALRDPDVANLPILKNEPDPVTWVANNLRVEFTGNSELMYVSLKADDPEEAKKLVEAVVKAYMTEIVDKEQEQRRARLTELEKLRVEKESDLRAKQEELKGHVQLAGSSEVDTLNMRQQIALQQYAALRSEESATKFRIMRLELELKSKKAAAERAGTVEVTDAELETALQVDPTAAPLLRYNEELRLRREEAKSVLVAGRETEYLERFEQTQKTNDAAIAARRTALREELKVRKTAGIQGDIAQLEQEIAVATEQKKSLQAEADEAETKANSVGTSSVDVEITRQEIDSIRDMMRTIGNEYERLEIELDSQARITIHQHAMGSKAPDSDKKVQYTACAGLAGFLFPFVGIMWLDLRAHRVNSSGDISATTGLDVIGAVPRLPGRGGRSVMDPDGSTRLREQLNESVDSIAARLLHLAERDQTRVVLVSSAVGGEGKTTLATQLALSLARTAHRVLLLDFDLRQPAIGQVFDMPLEPGLAGVLRHEAELHEAIQEPEIDHLWVLPAGRSDRRLLASLANGAVSALFTQLREEFDFVVVDGSPILPVADARFLCRHVDGVVLSVLRDVSSVPGILSACEVLAAFGVRPIGAVVTGFPSNHHYHSMNYGAIE